MSDQEERVPEFGERTPGVHYVDRPGAYGVAFDEERRRVCVLRSHQGDFLPGGGAHAGESEEDTLRREVREECGRAVEVVRRVGFALQYVEDARGQHIAKRCSFYELRLGRTVAGQTEEDHEFLWMPIEDACARLSHESQRWAVDAAVRMPE
ncbi:MAG: NUDIX domain-containing protein [Planctomycetota bacterium]